ncbi:MAG: diguanylate cyclase, partial [Acidimicrobiales bacterium]
MVAAFITIAAALVSAIGLPLVQPVSLPLALGIGVAFAASVAYPLYVSIGTRLLSVGIDEVFIALAVIALPGLEAMAVLAIGSAVGHRLADESPWARPLNVGAVTLAGGIATRLAGIIQPAWPGEPGQLIAAVVVMTATMALSALIMLPITSWQGGFGLWRTCRDSLPVGAAVFVPTLGLGIAATALLGNNPWLLAPLAIAMVGMFRLTHGLMSAEHERARADALLRAAISAQADPSEDAVNDAICAAAREIVGCRAAELDGRPGGWLSVPVPRREGRSLWLVASEPVRPVAPAKRDHLALEAVAAIAASCLDGVALVDRMRNQALTDPLTGLANRRSLLAELDRAIAEGTADGMVLAVAFVDLDGFKDVNDAHGHQVGDTLLRAVGSRLANVVRAPDLVARLGGDEFVVMARIPAPEAGALV